MKQQVLMSNFSAGEFSPELEGRADIEKFNASAKLLQNVVIMKQGGFTHRPPLDFRAVAKVPSLPGHMIPFISSSNDAFVLEFGDLIMRVWKNGALVEATIGFPYELVTPYTSADLSLVDYAQSGDTLIIVTGTKFPQRLRRFSDNVWGFDNVPFNPPAVLEIGERLAANLTISSPAVGAGRTITASAGVFLQADVGRTVTWGTGQALITGYTSATSVTATVQVAFNVAAINFPNWILGDSPMTTLTPSAAGPVGTVVTMTLSSPGWRIGDELGYVVINGGLVRLTGFVSSTVLNGVIVNELTSATGALTDTWVLQLPLWNQYDGYPRSVCFYQQRLWFGGTARFPESFWGSRSGLYFDFTPGTLDDSAVYKTIASTRVNPIQFMTTNKSLVMLGYSGEVEGRGGIEKPITQTNAQIDTQSEWGAAFVKPQTVGKEIVFVERGGTELRSLFPGQVDGYDSASVSIYSEHLLLSGVVTYSFEKKPNMVLWVATNRDGEGNAERGGLHAFTFNREQNTIAWASGFTDGYVERLATIPKDGRDVTYAMVKRTINGVVTRYIEILDWTIDRGKFDSHISVNGPLTNWPVPHLEGKTVAAIGDGVFLGEFTVTGGIITTPAGLDITTLHVGLPIESKAILRAPEIGTGSGTSQGQAMSTNHIWVRLLRSVGLTINGSTVEFRQLDTDLLDQQVPSFTGLKDVADYGWENGESDLTLLQNQGMPWTVICVVRNFTANPG